MCAVVCRPRVVQESDDDEIVRKTTLREVKVLRSLKQDNIVNLKVSTQERRDTWGCFLGRKYPFPPPKKMC